MSTTSKYPKTAGGVGWEQCDKRVAKQISLAHIDPPVFSSAVADPTNAQWYARYGVDVKVGDVYFQSNDSYKPKVCTVAGASPTWAAIGTDSSLTLQGAFANGKSITGANSSTNAFKIGNGTDQFRVYYNAANDIRVDSASGEAWTITPAGALTVDPAGAVTIAPSAAAAGAGSAIAITSGAGASGSAGGAMAITGGAPAGGNANGGALALVSGAASGSGTSGNVTLNCGTAVGGTVGAMTIGSSAASIALGNTTATIACASRMTITDGVGSGTARVVGGRAYTNTATGTALTNTTDKTVLGSYTIPASTLKAGSLVRVRFAVQATATHTTDTLQCWLYLGTTTMAGTALITTGLVDVANNDVCLGEFYLIARAAPGASAAITGWGSHQEPGAIGSATKTDFLTPTNFATNGALLLEVAGQWSVASAANSCQLEYLGVEVL